MSSVQLLIRKLTSIGILVKITKRRLELSSQVMVRELGPVPRRLLRLGSILIHKLTSIGIPVETCKGRLRLSSVEVLIHKLIEIPVKRRLKLSFIGIPVGKSNGG